MVRPSFVGIQILFGFLCGCNAIYSPALHLPERPLAKNDGQFTLGYGLLNDVNARVPAITDGNDLQLRYAYSDRFSISMKGWTSTSLLAEGFYNGGFLTNAIITFNDRDASTIVGIIPTWNLLFDNDGIHASGASVQLALWLKELSGLRPYIASGPGFIANNFADKNWGFGLISNFGLSRKLTEDISINGELSTMLTHKVRDADTYLSIGGLLGISWTFHNQ
jgi:hypothetical protein